MGCGLLDSMSSPSPHLVPPSPPHLSMRRVMAHQGHVSALQEDLIGDAMYTRTRPMAEWFGLGGRWEAEVRHPGGGAGGD